MNVAHRASGLFGRMPKTAKGAVVLMLLSVVASMAYVKEHVDATIDGLLHGHQTIAAELPQEFKLVEYRPGGDVKIAGIKVGTITDIEQTPSGTSILTMQVEKGTREKLGSAPSVQIYPTLLLGGRYFASLVPGGQGLTFSDDMIPLQRTHLPVEVYRVLNSFTPPARSGMQAGIRELDTTLRQGGIDALRALAHDAPATLDPAGQVLDAFRGTAPDNDLTSLVVGLDNTATAFTRRDDQVRAVLDAVQGSTAALAAGSPALADSIQTMPETLRVTRAGMADLQPALDKLTVTGTSFRPAARALNPMFEKLDPALHSLRPVLHELRDVLHDAQPLMEHFNPVVRKTTDVYDDLNGPVLDRLNGPIAHDILSQWRGDGPFSGGGASGNKVYQEVGYLFSRASQVFGWHDSTGAYARLSAGVGLNSVGGTGINMSLEQYMEQMGMARPLGPGAFAGKAGPLGKAPAPPIEIGRQHSMPPPSQNPLLLPLEQSGEHR